ncbi:ABC-2 type transport system ATP-binding protein [Clostridium acidisoli DSM 12555]|uniref:ABC-2 type transport system ATP-binding protein n=1 Tax=Clostridium acidisoli DSM 12555 TaxID=1121291 RepID=A0A1W1X7U8_9CLOT|nr:ABC transporter ATP-binding protein [Clostridium acidisoli]SMC20022.1 ABC-2 type transport system ATP-binding protein [Clostridium acidisoli DSM 12555]
MENVIFMKEIRKVFKDKVVLNNITFNVRKNEIFGLLGPSGSGKTTTIKILTSQIMPTSGKASILNNDVYSFDRSILSRVGILSDNSGVYERLTVWDNLKLFADICGADKKSIEDILERVGLGNDKRTTVKKLSKGMKQRLILARSIINKPELLFLDEPTSSLDPFISNEIHNLLKEINSEGTTIFLTTHDMVEADKLCDCIAFLNNGTIVEVDSPENLKLKYAKPVIQVKLKCQDNKIFLSKNAENAEKIRLWIATDELESIHSYEPSIEEIFLKVTGRKLK